MTQFVYGGRNTVLALGMGLMGGEATPFVGFMPRQEDMQGNVMVSGSPNTAATIEMVEAKGGTIVWFENPDAAERFHSTLAQLFDIACGSPWGDKEETVAKC